MILVEEIVEIWYRKIRYLIPEKIDEELDSYTWKGKQDGNRQCKEWKTFISFDRIETSARHR